VSWSSPSPIRQRQDTPSIFPFSRTEEKSQVEVEGEENEEKNEGSNRYGDTEKVSESEDVEERDDRKEEEIREKEVPVEDYFKYTVIPHPEKIEVTDVHGDGNCVLRAVSASLYNDENKFVDLKLMVQQEMSENKDYYDQIGIKTSGIMNKEGEVLQWLGVEVLFVVSNATGKGNLHFFLFLNF